MKYIIIPLLLIYSVKGVNIEILVLNLLNFYFSFRRFATVSRPARTAIPNPASPVLDSVEPVFGRLRSNLIFLFGSLESFGLRDSVFTISPEPLSTEVSLPLVELLFTLPSTTSIGTSIVNSCPSFPLSTILAIFLPKVVVSGYSISTISIPSGKFSLDLISFSFIVCPFSTSTIPLTINSEISNSSTSLITGFIL